MLSRETGTMFNTFSIIVSLLCSYFISFLALLLPSYYYRFYASIINLSIILSTGPPSISPIIYDDISCSTTHATASWNSSSDPLCEPVSHDVTISPSDGVMITKITNTSYDFTGLTPDTRYTVIVACINIAGTGDSSTVTFHANCQSTMSAIRPTGKFMFIMIYVQ